MKSYNLYKIKLRYISKDWLLLKRKRELSILMEARWMSLYCRRLKRKCGAKLIN
jgi:hypothetical protein